MKKISTLCLLAVVAINAHAGNNQAPDNINFPTTNKSYLKEPLRMNGDEVGRIGTNINKDTVRDILGNPHFKEFNSHSWNYWLSIRKPNTATYHECQLRVDFSNKKLVGNYYWKPADCTNYLAADPVTVQQPAPMIIKEVIKEKVEPRVITIKTDGFFDFGKFTVDHLNASSREEITSAVTKLNKSATSIQFVDIVGYTDRIGDAEANYNLGLKRAETIKSLLLENGLQLDERKVRVSSRGESDPKTSCSDNQSKKDLVACLADDRRVEINILTTR